MTCIRDLLARDLSQSIEEVVQVDQRQEKVVRDELQEYVFTQRIKEDYETLLRAISDGPGDPREDVGVWISGFFGSGKSSFAKNLGYVLANDEVAGRPASELFLEQLQQQAPDDPLTRQIRQRLTFVNARLETVVVMFDVQKDRDVQAGESIAEIMYRVLLRTLDYSSSDHALAELEIGLEEEERLGAFVRLCAELYGDEVRPAPLGTDEAMPPSLADAVTPAEYAIWRRVRISSERRPRTVAVLRALDPHTYADEASANAMLDATPELTVRTLVARSFELMARRRPEQALAYIMDEVGQYVARHVDRIENLRAIVEEFGKESRNRVQAGQAPAPVWIVVTSQEKLNEVVAAIDAQRVELARLEDRFHYRIDMAPADIREVATKRVLSKTLEGAARLTALFQQHAGRLRTNTALEETSRRQDLDAEAFAQHYPYLPHLIDLSIDIVSGIRLQGGAPRHIGGSNRTLIKQAYEMLVGPRTGLADAAVGTLVTLDRVYDLVETNLSSEIQRDVGEVARRWPECPMHHRVVKAIALLQNVTDLPRTAKNLAALLHPDLSAESCVAQVEESLQALNKAQFIRQSEHGWKLQTHQEKEWTTERNELALAPRERNEILRRSLGTVLESASVDRYRYKNLRTFRAGISWGAYPLTKGTDIRLCLEVVDAPESLATRRETIRNQSRQPEHQNEAYWLITLNDEIDDLVAEVHRSRTMIERYQRVSAENKLSAEKAACLNDERTRVLRLEDRLQRALRERLQVGESCFRGVSHSASDLGDELADALATLYSRVVPELYHNLEMAAYPLDAGLAESLLKAANLQGLDNTLYQPPPKGLGLVRREGQQYLVNTEAPAAKEVLAYLRQQIGYGKDVNGTMLEARFCGLGYGWELDMLRLICAALYRAGMIRVTYQGKLYQDHAEPLSHKAFSGTQPFRAASFTLPKEPPDIATQVVAAKAYETLTGSRVDVSISAISHNAKEWAKREQEDLVRLQALADAHHLPIKSVLNDYESQLHLVLENPQDDTVRALASDGDALRTLRDRVASIREGASEDGLARLQRLRRAVGEVYPELEPFGEHGTLLQRAQQVREALSDDQFYQPNLQADRAAQALMERYHDRYRELHTRRQQAYTDALEAVQASHAWTAVADSGREELIAPLRIAIHELALEADDMKCRECGASLAQLSADLDAVDKRRADALAAIQRKALPEEQVERVSLARLAASVGPLSSPDEVERALERIRARLMALVSDGIKVILE